MSLTDQPSLSIVIPLFREEANAGRLLARVHDGMKIYRGPWEVICVDDGSPDRTLARLQQARAEYGDHVRIVELQRNFGQTAAMQAGIDAARGEIIATMDGDLQNDPQDIPRMVTELQQRDLDLLQGWRKHRQDTLARRLPSLIANRLIARVTGVKLHDYGCSLKIYRADVVKQVRLFGEMHRFIPVWVAGVTTPRRIGETPVTHHARQFGESKYGIGRTFRVMVDLVFVFFFLRYRARPGHFFGSIGLVSGTLGSLLMTWLLFVKFVLGEDIGNRPLLIVSVLLILMALQFLTTGVLAEMLSRIFLQGPDSRSFVVRRPPGPDAVAGWHPAAVQPDSAAAVRTHPVAAPAGEHLA